MAKLIINNFEKGLSNQKDRNLPAGQFYIGDGVDIYSDPGYIQPGIASSVITKSDDTPQIITGTFEDICVDSLNSKIYLHGGTKLQQITNSTTFAFNATFDGTNYYSTITTADGQVGHNNLIIYPIGTARKLFYTWSKTSGGNAGNIGMYPLTGTSFDDDWGTTVPAGAAASIDYARHPLLEQDGYLWFGNGNKLGKLDGQTGANGTIVYDALELPVDWEITKLFSTSNYIGIVAWLKGTSGTNTPCRIYFYDGSSDSWSFFIPIQENAVYDVMNKNGEILFVGGGREQQGVLYRLGGNGAIKIMALKHYVNGTEIKCGVGTYPNASAVQNNLLLIGNPEYGNVIWAYGQKEEGSPISFSIPYRISTGVLQTDQIKTVKPIDSDTILVSWKDVTVNYLSKILLTATARTGANFKSGYTDFGQRVRVNYVKFYFKPLASGDNVTVSLDTNYGTSNTLGTISYAKDGAITEKIFRKQITCHSFRPVISWTAGKTAISKIVISYNFISD